MYVVLLETGGNQGFIFATNKLRENLGASQATQLCCTHWLIEAVGKITKTSFGIDRHWNEIRADLKNSEKNPPGGMIEVVIATSGLAILIVGDKCDAKKLIGIVTNRALREAPGIDLAGCYEELTGDFGDTLRKAHQRLREVRAKIPGPESRFQRLPVIASCSTSGLPAKQYGNSSNERRSEVTRGKRELRKSFWERVYSLGGPAEDLAAVTSILEHLSEDQPFVEEILEGTDIIAGKSASELGGVQANRKQDEKDSWIAVIHADGNGFGEIFSRFGEFIGTSDIREYSSRLRSFSIALEEINEAAFWTAFNGLQRHKLKLPGSTVEVIPLVPIILGGDDLTVVCKANVAVQFLKAYVQEFEKLCETRQEFIKIFERMPEFFDKDKKGLGICAGIAFVRPHYLFSVAYSLAEELCQEAKKHTKYDYYQPASAFDYHVVYDSGHVNLKDIRQELKVGDSLLANRPYLLADAVAKDGKAPDRPNLDSLERAVRALHCSEDGKRLSSAKLHEWRTALFMGDEAGERIYALTKGQCSRHSREALLGGDSLFLPNGRSQLLDALDIKPFLREEEDAKDVGE